MDEDPQQRTIRMVARAVKAFNNAAAPARGAELPAPISDPAEWKAAQQLEQARKHERERAWFARQLTAGDLIPAPVPGGTGRHGNWVWQEPHDPELAAGRYHTARYAVRATPLAVLVHCDDDCRIVAAQLLLGEVALGPVTAELVQHFGGTLASER